MTRRNGFTLLELSVSMSILAVVSLLSFIALVSTLKTAVLAGSKAEIQRNVRDTMLAISSEARAAYTQRLVDAGEAPEDVASISVAADGRSITFQIPVEENSQDFFGASSPITYRFEYEDGEPGEGDALFDPKEDENGDGVLTRRIAREQDGVITPVGAANDISNVEFELVPNQAAGNAELTTLRVRIEASRRFGLTGQHFIETALESRIHLEN